MRRMLLLLVLPACFGKGAAPSGDPSQGEILFAIQPPNPEAPCQVSPFIGSVAFANGEGYLATHGFLPQCDGQGNASQRIDANIIHIPQGDTVSMAGTTTEGGGQRPRVAIGGGTVEWVYAEANGSGAPPLELGTLDNPEQPVAGATNIEAALVFDGTTTIIATAAPPAGPSDSNAPRFPCCMTQGGNDPMGQLISLNPPATVGPRPLHCAELKDCIVASADAVFYWVDLQGTHLERAARPDLGTLTDYPDFLGPNLEPGGMAASASLVAWTESLNFLGDGANTRSQCKVSTLPSDAPAGSQSDVILETSAFSCLDIALDDTHAYFTIVELVGGKLDDQVIGIGLGRVALGAPHEVETLDLGFVDANAGPRQLLLDGDDIITISPFTVGRFKKTVLDGASDF